MEKEQQQRKAEKEKSRRFVGICMEKRKLMKPYQTDQNRAETNQRNDWNPKYDPGRPMVVWDQNRQNDQNQNEIRGTVQSRAKSRLSMPFSGKITVEDIADPRRQAERPKQERERPDKKQRNRARHTK